MSASHLDTSDPRWQLTERVLNAPLFEKSPRLRSFLRFICEMELTGRRLEINEHAIGVQVFGRPAAYNPGEDSIVRSQARFLRQRLDEYFRGTGRHEPIHITIPKGSYVPLFEASVAASTAATQEPEVQQRFDADTERILILGATGPTAEPLQAPPQRLPRRWWLIAAVVLLACVAAAAWGWRRSFERFASPESRFWNTLFDPKRAQMIVPADSTLILIEELTGKQVTLQNYLSRDYLTHLELPACLPSLTKPDLDASHYTSMADLDLVARLVRVPQLESLHPAIRSARELSISDVKDANVVLIGGARANPWVELFSGPMNFSVDFDWKAHRNAVINRKPRAGEQPLYLESTNEGGSDTPRRVYGLVAYEPSLDHEGDALLVSGTSSAGTQSAADFLLNGRSFGTFLRTVERRDGSIPHFELLLEARSLGGNVPEFSIVAYRLAP